VDNAFDEDVETAHAATGVFNLAPPRMVDGGVRLTW